MEELRTGFFKLLGEKHEAIRQKGEAYRALHYIQDELESATETSQILQLRAISWRGADQNNIVKAALLKRLVLLCLLGGQGSKPRSEKSHQEGHKLPSNEGIDTE